jgi:hypothetical protein
MPAPLEVLPKAPALSEFDSLPTGPGRTIADMRLPIEIASRKSKIENSLVFMGRDITEATVYLPRLLAFCWAKRQGAENYYFCVKQPLI